jgi:PAS domain S-box-containing protein
MKTSTPNWKPVFDSPIRLLAIIAGTIFVAHTIAMEAFALLPPWPKMLQVLTESAFLTGLLFPALYLYSFRPLIVHIRERDEAEEAMRQSEHKYRQLFENLSDAAFLTDVETGRILDTNKQGEAMLGKIRSQILGMNQRELFSNDEQKKHLERFAQYATKDSAQAYESRIFQEDNESIPVHISGVPITLYGRRLVIELYRLIAPVG